jgi:hypothetical protein
LTLCWLGETVDCPLCVDTTNPQASPNHFTTCASWQKLQNIASPFSLYIFTLLSLSISESFGQCASTNCFKSSAPINTPAFIAQFHWRFSRGQSCHVNAIHMLLKKADAIVAVGWRILRKRLKHSRHLDSFIGGGSDPMSCTVLNHIQ